MACSKGPHESAVDRAEASGNACGAGGTASERSQQLHRGDHEGPRASPRSHHSKRNRGPRAPAHHRHPQLHKTSNNLSSTKPATLLGAPHLAAHFSRVVEEGEDCECKEEAKSRASEEDRFRPRSPAAAAAQGGPRSPAAAEGGPGEVRRWIPHAPFSRVG